MSESESENAVSDSVSDLDDDELDELADRVASMLDGRDKESVSGSLGMMSLTVETHESLDDAVDAFQKVWEGRIEEIRDAESTTKRELTQEETTIFFG